MEDPLEGWRVLSGFLKEGGLMKIGLYSKHARQHIEKKFVLKFKTQK